jgi:SOS-response transcriptional repressor LexA
MMQEKKHERLNFFIEKIFSSKQEFAKVIGISPQNLSQYLSGKINKPSNKMIEVMLGRGLNLQWLNTGEGDMLVSGGSGTVVVSGTVVAESKSKRPLRFAPEIGQISTSNYMMPVYEIAVPAGIPITVFDDIPPSYINMRERYRVQVRGDSLIGVGIEHGDTLEIRLISQFIDGDIIMARVDDEVTIKRIRNGSGYRLLVPANEDYKPITLDDSTDWECLGVVEHVMKKAR